MARTSRNSSKNRPTDKRSKRQGLVTTSSPPRKWTPILWSRSTRNDKSRSSGRNGHDKPSSSALAREIRGIVLLLFAIFLAGALGAAGAWILMAIAYSMLMAASLSWNPIRVVVTKRVRTLEDYVRPTPAERAGLDPEKEIVVPAPNSAASVVSATLLEPTPEEMPQ